MSAPPLHPHFERPDDAALDQQVRAFLASRSMIQAHIHSMVRDATLAEDVFQEVWLRFERVTRRGETVVNVTAWCRAAARLVALESWREQSRQQPMPDDELNALVDQAYAEEDERGDYWQQHREALSLCMDALPQRSRELLSLRYRTGQPVADIATRLGQSVGSVKTALCRLRTVLAECVRKRLTL
jgi:RNA polymerase sigma-70 factor, ECF subfamily